MSEQFLKNCWYQAAWVSELGGGSLTRRLLGIPILLFTTDDGYGALHDRCPHRFAPLSTGTVEKGAVTCGYHGLAFDGTGRCVGNPHGPITSAMRATAYPVVERHTAIWIWMGDPSLADNALIPDLSFIDCTPQPARIELYMHTAADYRLVTDNLMDLSHADYLHSSSIGGMMSHTKARTFDRGSALVAEWTSPSCPAPPIFQAKIPSPAMSNYWIEVEWQAPTTMVLSNAVVPAGTVRESKDELISLHGLTPETTTSTHYFVCATRGEQLDDAGLTRFLKGALEAAFVGEDKPMLELQQERMGSAEFWSLNPILLRGDAAAVQVRRRLDKLVAEEVQV